MADNLDKAVLEPENGDANLASDYPQYYRSLDPFMPVPFQEQRMLKNVKQLIDQMKNPGSESDKRFRWSYFLARKESPYPDDYYYSDVIFLETNNLSVEEMHKCAHNWVEGQRLEVVDVLYSEIKAGKAKEELEPLIKFAYGKDSNVIDENCGATVYVFAGDKNEDHIEDENLAYFVSNRWNYTYSESLKNEVLKHEEKTSLTLGWDLNCISEYLYS